MRRFVLTMLVAVAALLGALAATTGAGAVTGTTGRDVAAGGGSLFEAQVANELERFAIGANSDPLGADPRGQVMYRSRPFIGAPAQQTFHGDVSEGCFFALLNRAVAVGRLPERERFVEPITGRLIEYVGVWVEDNGEPVHGQPVDRGFAALLFTQTALRTCAGHQGGYALMHPLEEGNVVVHDALL